MTRPEAGEVRTVMPGLRQVLAPNPGPMTHWGTNSYIVGEGRVAVIDPGPEDAGHLDALLRAIRGETITHILVTHPHRDHSPLACHLSQKTDAPVLGYGPPEAGRRPIMRTLAAEGLARGGEGVDHSFRPEGTLAEGDVIYGDGWTLDVLHTPGHFAGHLSFGIADSLISGDHVMDWSSSLVSPPDGDIRTFMETSTRLRDLGTRRLFPAHGAAIEDPADRLSWLIAHRQTRETAIRHALTTTPQTITEITRSVYTDIPTRMLPAAERNVLAHLIDLTERNLIHATPVLGCDAGFSRT